MSIVTISNSSRIQLSREILDHLKVSPGREMELLKMPNVQITITRPALTMSVDQFVNQSIVFVEPEDEKGKNIEADAGKSPGAE